MGGLREGERDHDEVDAESSNCEGTDECRHERADDRADDERRRELELELRRRERGDVAAETEVDTLADREQPRVAQEQIEAKCRHGVDEDQRRDGP